MKIAKVFTLESFAVYGIRVLRRPAGVISMNLGLLFPY